MTSIYEIYRERSRIKRAHDSPTPKAHEHKITRRSRVYVCVPGSRTNCSFNIPPISSRDAAAEIDTDLIGPRTMECKYTDAVASRMKLRAIARGSTSVVCARAMPT